MVREQYTKEIEPVDVNFLNETGIGLILPALVKTEVEALVLSGVLIPADRVAAIIAEEVARQLTLQPATVSTHKEMRPIPIPLVLPPVFGGIVLTLQQEEGGIAYYLEEYMNGVFPKTGIHSITFGVMAPYEITPVLARQAAKVCASIFQKIPFDEPKPMGEIIPMQVIVSTLSGLSLRVYKVDIQSPLEKSPKVVLGRVLGAFGAMISSSLNNITIQRRGD